MSAYRWRDPERCSPQRLAELEAHDKHLAAIAAVTPVVRAPVREGKRGEAGRAIQAARTAAKQAAFYAARDSGLSISRASAQARVSKRTGGRWDRERKEASHG